MQSGDSLITLPSTNLYWVLTYDLGLPSQVPRESGVRGLQCDHRPRHEAFGILEADVSSSSQWRSDMYVSEISSERGLQIARFLAIRAGCWCDEIEEEGRVTSSKRDFMFSHCYVPGMERALHS